MKLTDEQLIEFGATPEQIARHRECELESDRRNMAQVDALIDAGWKFEIPSMPDIMEVWQWAWRRPARRPGSKGMRFASTNQAYQHLRRHINRELPEINQ